MTLQSSSRSTSNQPDIQHKHPGWVREGEMREIKLTKQYAATKQITLEDFGRGFLLKITTK